MSIIPISPAVYRVLDTNTYLSDLELNLGNNKVIFYVDGTIQSIDLPPTITRTYRIDSSI